MKKMILIIMMLGIVGCIDPIGPMDWSWNGSGGDGHDYSSESTSSCRKFFAMYGDYGAREISNESDAAEFCKKTAWKHFHQIEYYESGPDSGYAHMVECCNY